MNNIEKAKKIINETKTALVKYVISENISKGEKLSFIKFIKESSNYNILHFAAKGSFPKTKNIPIKSLLESAIINRVINKLNPKKSEIQHFTESCKSVLLSNYVGNRKVINFIMNEASSYEICYLTMVGKLPTNYSTKAQHYLFESIGNKIAKKYGKTSFITEGFIHEFNVTKLKPYTGSGEKPFDPHGWETNNIRKVKYGIDKTNNPEEISNTYTNNPYTAPVKPENFQDHERHDIGIANVITNKFHNLINQGKMAGSDAIASFNREMSSDDPAAVAAGGAAVGAGAVAAAGLAIYGANKLYRKFFGNASKAAQGKPPAQAAAILKNAKMKAGQAKMADLQKSLAGCKGTKNPAKCQKLIQDKIKAERMKASKIRR
jgi:hypothetical protein